MKKMKSLLSEGDDNPNRKLLVFTTFKDTANYLYGQLEGLARSMSGNMSM